ncbi:hypothetical protein NVS89_06815 [Ancylobacter sp. MQZ15Z-1]|uniref:Uncharacterized protein n=1 Tax=Ancylobacter mangrovi TaxID=2972472 RepID=A0A9X2PF32_9HYPH|nr:hypothetical protein [Ancylobacter mangrovi]MCS0494805.1 hypothetical protein [Ancylobacter mangrovi]
MRITPKAFVDDYDERARFAQQPITDFALVDYILLREDKSAITGMVSAEVEQDFAGLLGRVPDHRAWEGEVRRIVAMRQRDVDGRVGTGTAYGPKGAEVAHARERFEAALLSRNLDEGGLYAELYRLLDDQERGGLEYTIDLVAKLHARLDDAGGGIIARLRAAEEAYAQRASRLNAEQLQASIDRLQQAAQSSFLTGGGRKASEKYLNQVRDDLIAMLQARLRAIACREAVVLLEHVAQFLGVPQDMDERGETSWSGLIGEFQARRKRVRSLLSVLDADTLRLQDALARGDGGTFFVIRDKGVELPPVAPDGGRAAGRSRRRRRAGEPVRRGPRLDHRHRRHAGRCRRHRGVARPRGAGAPARYRQAHRQLEPLRRGDAGAHRVGRRRGRSRGAERRRRGSAGRRGLPGHLPASAAGRAGPALLAVQRGRAGRRPL